MAKTTAAQRKSPSKATANVAKTNGEQGLDTVQKMQAAQDTTPVKEAKEKAAKKKPDYPSGTKLFTYKPADGRAPIQFPLEFEYPNKVWLWKLNKQPFLAQTWAWMTRAKVPDAIQLRAQELPDEEYPILFEKWFEAMGGGATPGE